MFGTTAANDQPIAWVGRFPVRLATCLAGLYLIGLFATSILLSAGGYILPFAFNAQAFIHGAFWQPLTCTFLDTPTFFSLFNIFFLGWAGTEVEKYLGRARFLKLVLLLLAVPPVVILLWAPLGVHWTYFGPYEVSIGLFIAFATLYPGIELFGWITLKWLAFAGLLLGSMQQLPEHRWGNLSVLWIMAGASFGFIRIIQERVLLPSWMTEMKWLRRKPKFHVVPNTVPRRMIDPEDIDSVIDPLLEKISKHGINSLTASERRALDHARNQLLKKSS